MKKATQSNNIICQLLILLYEILRLPRFKVIIGAVFTSAISIEIKFLNNTSFPRVIHIVITIVLYLLFLYASVTVDNYTKAVNARYTYFKEIINQQSGINRHIGGKLYRICSNISTRTSYVPTKNDIDILLYQDIGSLVCHAIYTIIKTATSEEGHQVTLMHKVYEKSGGYHFRMIAYANKNDAAPEVLNTVYRPGDNPRYYHQMIFEENINKIYILKNRKEVSKAFVENKKNKEMDIRIQQYVAIPVYCEVKGVISVLQIDTDIPDLFGISSDEIEEFAKVFMPFIHQLIENYYRENLVNCLVKKIEILSRKRREA